jgi:hypothetical protein
MSSDPIYRSPTTPTKEELIYKICPWFRHPDCCFIIFALNHLTLRLKMPQLLAFCILLSLLCGSDLIAQKHTGRLLPIHYQKQLASQLCWAAAGEIVMKYWHERDTNALLMSQCDQALARYQIYHPNKGADLECSYDSVADGLNRPYAPFQGFIPIVLNYNYTSQNGVIPWKMLVSQIDSGMPVISLLGWKGVTKKTSVKQGNHFIVVDGYQVSSITGQRFVSYCDPWNADKSVHKLTTYDNFAEPDERIFLDHNGYKANSHVLDIYHIRPKGYTK